MFGSKKNRFHEWFETMDKSKLEEKVAEKIAIHIITSWDFNSTLTFAKIRAQDEITNAIKQEVLELYRADILSKITPEEVLKATVNGIKEQAIKKTAEIIKG